MDKEEINNNRKDLARIIANYNNEVIRILEAMGYEVSKKKDDDLVLVNIEEKEKEKGMD